MSGAAARLLPEVAAIARAAAAAILEVYHSGEFATRAKADDSPLTAADLRAHELIVAALTALTPQLPVLSEESALQCHEAERARWQRYWLVDPLDGTREFLSGNGEFTVNIALIEEHAPVLGVVHVPVRGVSYQGVPGSGAWRAQGAQRTPLRVAPASRVPLRVVASRSHRGDSLERFLGELGAHELLPIGSSLKFCLIADGTADVYPRLGPTSEWDTAAAHAVVLGAGGTVCAVNGEPLRYNTHAGLLNPHFVAYGPADRDWLALLR
jgi:3'(2'), 5'-bisphosphate nucleotidase